MTNHITTDTRVKQFIAQTLSDLTNNGYRCIPAKDGKPLGGFKEGQQYPSNDPLWQQANMIAINQRETIVIDLDGYKEDAADAATIAAYLGMTPEQLEAARVQAAPERQSYHWMFRLPEGASDTITGNCGIWAKHVDLRVGNSNQLVFVKHGKQITFPPVAELPMLDLSRMLVPFPKRAAAPVSNGPVTLSDSTSAKGRALLREMCDKLAQQQEGGRNAALNEVALIIGHYVGGGEIAKHDAEAALTAAALSIGLSAGETAATIRSGLERGIKEPQNFGPSAEEIFGAVKQSYAAPLCAAPVMESFKEWDAPVSVANSGDHYEDAGYILMSTGGKLRVYQGEAFWWNGVYWESVEMVRLKAAIEKMCSGLTKVTDSRISGTTNSVMRQCPELPARENDNRLFFRNGVLDVMTGDFKPHSSDNFNRHALTYDFQRDAVCPVWDAFTASVWPGDTECRDLIEEWIGYNLISSYEHQKYMVLLGLGGSGKGTIARMMKPLVGEVNYGAPSLSALANDAMLHGMSNKQCLFMGDVKSVDMNKRGRALENLLSITGNDEIAYDRKYLTAAQCKMPGRITMACNELPRFSDAGGALDRRMMILPFNHKPTAPDTKLEDKLIAELPGIVNRAIEGLKRLNMNGAFTVPQCSLEEKEQAREIYSPFDSFMRDNVAVTGNDADVTPAGALYRTYTLQASAQGDNVMGQKAFSAKVNASLRGTPVKYGNHRHNGDQLRGWKGLKITASVQ